MLTYDLTTEKGPLYLTLCENIKADIVEGRLSIDDKLPSKRTLAKNLGVSIITVQNAYDQLIDEGYIYTVPKKGYFVTDIAVVKKGIKAGEANLNIKVPKKDDGISFDFSSGRTSVDTFPFSVWAKLMRETISQGEQNVLMVSPCGGVYELRKAIAGHLGSFRGMSVDPDQIIIGAGTEYLYGLITKLLGTESVYALENPGYKKISQVYESNNARCAYVGLDEDGIKVSALDECNADIVHISANHHFPTGITMPTNRRQELLAWANLKEGRYIIEDDYDSEFRFIGKPIPPVTSMDMNEKVIYINTFSKSLTSSVRIAYMVLPEHLANKFYKELSFYSCTVSTFEQHTLAKFIDGGYFEKHINRMRLYYGRKRKKLLETIRENFSDKDCRVIENASGLHFILEFRTSLTDAELKNRLRIQGVNINPVTEYDYVNQDKDKHQFIIDYSGIDLEGLDEAISRLKNILCF